MTTKGTPPTQPDEPDTFETFKNCGKRQWFFGGALAMRKGVLDGFWPAQISVFQRLYSRGLTLILTNKVGIYRGCHGRHSF